jgi:hypothetical protein
MASSEGANTRSCDALADLYFVATSSGRDAGKSLDILEASAMVSAITLTWFDSSYCNEGRELRSRRCAGRELGGSIKATIH